MPEENGREKSPHIEGGCNRFTKGVTSTGAFALVSIVPRFASKVQASASLVKAVRLNIYTAFPTANRLDVIPQLDKDDCC